MAKGQIAITPAGRLLFVTDDEEAPEIQPAIEASLARAFAESSAEGLLQLASRWLDEHLPAGLVFWRERASSFFHALCGLGEEAVGSTDRVAPPPGDDELEARIAAAPPMRGLEYLSAD